MPARKVNLVAVQARMERGDYRDEAAFRTKIASLMKEAAARTDFSLPTLVAFPELIGMYLSFLPYHWECWDGEKTLEAGAMKLVASRLSSLPEALRSSPRAAARYVMHIETAVETERMYTETFSTLAREYGAYVCAGSIALPPMESEPSKGGRHVADASKVYNVSYLFSPRGICLARTPKAEMTKGLEEIMFDAGPASQLLPVETTLGRIGTLVCFDGFHETLVERYDALGVEILLKPSYNQHPWQGPSTYDAAHGEGENWLAAGCPSIIQGRENIRFGVNPMLVGAVFDDTAAEGLSSISVNTGDPAATWRDGVRAMASDPAGEEIVAATVETGGS